MRWPPEHPALTDPALARWAVGADELCPEARVVGILRHLPGRRVASLVETPAGLRVLKVFASPRARGNLRRLEAFARSRAAGLVPEPIGADQTGHVALVSFIEGTPLDSLRGEQLVSAAGLAGRSLVTLHASGAELDRTWSTADEAGHLRRTSGPLTGELVERTLAHWTPRQAHHLVPSHRDCHPCQAVFSGDRVHWIDLDDAALAPAGLDVGNFLAHLEASPGVLPIPAATRTRAAAAFVAGYGAEPPDLECWWRLSMARLAALAETRHRSPDSVRRISLLLERRPLRGQVGWLDSSKAPVLGG